MPTQFVLSPGFEAGLRDALQAAAACRQADPFAPVCFLLPDGRALQAARKLAGDTIGIRFFQFYGLSQLILDSAGLPVQRLSETAQRRLLRQVLKQQASSGGLTSFLPIQDTPGFAQVVLEWLQEMKSQGIPPEAVQADALRSGLERDRQLAAVYTAYQEFLIANACSDNDGLLWLAAEALEMRPALPVSQELFAALGFDQFNPLQIRILRAFAPHCADLRIYLPWDTARPPDSLALARPASALQALRAALDGQQLPLDPPGPPRSLLEAVQRGIFEPVPTVPAELPADDASFTLVAAASREDEVRWALKAVKRRLLAGAAPEQIALLAPDPGVYARMVEVAAEEYGLPLQMERRLSDSPALAALLNLLALAPDFAWRETLDALRSPYFRQAWLSSEQINQLEQLSRERPVTDGREQWRFALQPLARRADSADDEEREEKRLAARLEPDALAAIESGLNAFFDWITPPASASWREHSLWLQQAVLGLFPENEEDQADPAPAPASLDMVNACARAADPATARRDLQALQLAARALAALVDAAELVAPEAGPIPWSEYLAELQRVLPSLALLPDPLQPGLRLMSLEAGRSLSVDHLLVLGLAEGEFPRLPAPDVFYSARERAAHPLPLIRPTPGEQASLWWQVLNSCRASLTLLRPRLDDKGAPWLPSSFWEAALAAVAGGAERVGEQTLPVIVELDYENAASPAELLAACVRDGGAIPLALRQPWQAASAAALRMRERQSWQPVPGYEGVLRDESILAALERRYGSEHNWSPSRLNRYGKCPYIFFAQYILELDELADPAEGLDVMQRGLVLHAVLEDLYRVLTDRQLDVTPTSLAEVEALLEATCARVFEHAPQRFGFLPGALWRYEQAELRRLLRALLGWEAEQNGPAPRFHPFRQELGFGVALSSAAGLSFNLHGVIDRVDQDGQGSLRLLDYKSGSSSYGKPEMLKGEAFQTPLYALAAEQLLGQPVVESAYLLVQSREISGLLKFSGPVAEDVTVRAVVERAAQIIQAIRTGRFPTSPAKLDTGPHGCGACEFRGLCRADRHALVKARREAQQREDNV